MPADPRKPFVSILVPAYNEETELPLLLTSIRSSFEALGRMDYEVIVCDNDSQDATAQVAEAAGARVVFEAHNQIARARNAAAAHAMGQWLIFIDADSQMTPGLLRQTLERMNLDRCVGGGALVAMDPARTPLGMRIALGLWNTVSRLFHWAAGSYLFCQRRAWDEVNGFDERYYASEEIAFSRSLKRWGRKRELRFVILTQVAVPTSPRKAELFSLWEMTAQVLVCCVPGSLRRRDRCGFWYRREPQASARKN